MLKEGWQVLAPIVQEDGPSLRSSGIWRPFLSHYHYLLHDVGTSLDGVDIQDTVDSTICQPCLRKCKARIMSRDFDAHLRCVQVENEGR